MTRFVFDFAEGNKDQKDLLGGKGANLAEMTRIGLPVPPGFTVTTDACRYYMQHGQEPETLAGEVDEHLAALEATMGRKLGDPLNPLLVSVRSGAKFSMPGMMDTILNIGLNDESVVGLAEQAGGNERFAWDSYRRLVSMFGQTVLGLDHEAFEHGIDALKAAKGTRSDLDLDTEDLKALTSTYKGVILDQTGHEFPQDARVQLAMAIRAVFDSWNTERAQIYRRREKISDDLGTAVNVGTMVFGNGGMTSGTGVAFTRNPATGESGVYGDYLQNAQGEDVVAGIRNTVPLTDLEQIHKPSYDQLMDIMSTLENHYRDMCDIEFTVENEKLWMLQTRVGKRTAQAAFVIAKQLVDEGLITPAEAVTRVTGDQLAQLMFPRFEASHSSELLGKGMSASPGAAVGRAVFDSDTAVQWTERGEKVILVRRETNPDDLKGMVCAEGILTSRGGKTSHAAVVARGMGRTCVCGADCFDVDLVGKKFTTDDGVVISEGDLISVNGSTGEVFAGEVPVVDSLVVQHLEGTAGAVDDETVAAVGAVMQWADDARRMAVRANADTPEDAARARRFGAQGIGLCRTEHMFLGDRRELVEHLIVAETEDERAAALNALLPLQRGDFVGILEAMDGLPVTIRLIDPPLHEFLPDLTDLSVQVAREDDAGNPDAHHHQILSAVKRLHEANPMLGLRGVRLGIAIPGLFEMQARAIIEAAVDRVKAGGDPRPEIMIPLVATEEELKLVRTKVEAAAKEVIDAAGVEVQYKIGTMIELPRAAVTAGDIAKVADFFSFGTNDLTQMTWGFSRDDVEAAFFSTYLEHGIFPVSPFETLDRGGVGQLVKLAATAGRATRPDIHLGVCGEHGGDPDSIHFFDSVGLDYVSCSPFRVPIARLESARSTIEGGTGA